MKFIMIILIVTSCAMGVPRQKFLSVRHGMHNTEVEKILGEPYLSEHEETFFLYYYKCQGCPEHRMYFNRFNNKLIHTVVDWDSYREEQRQWAETWKAMGTMLQQQQQRQHELQLEEARRPAYQWQNVGQNNGNN